MNKYILALLITVLSFSLVLPVVADENGFDPGIIVPDQAFGNYFAYAGPEDIQRFLEIRGSVLSNTSNDFLKKLREPADIELKNRLEDPNPNLGRLRTAAELIFDAAQMGKINPQVILTTLQKEQSLITGTFTDEARLQRHLDRAMGYACPDGGVCGDLFLGFYSQLFGNVDNEGNRYLGAVRSFSKSFYTEVNGVVVGRGPMIDASGSTFSSAPKVKTARIGDTITVNNTQGPPYNAPATQQVTLQTSAAAALYRFTPHVYNGNYNFWKFFTEWFKFGNGSLVRLASSNEVFFLENGERRTVSGTVLTQRGLDVTKAFVVTEDQLADYALAKPLPPKEGTIVSRASGGDKYIVQNSKLRKVTDFVAKSKGLSLNSAIFLPDNEVNSYEFGENALPAEESLVKGAGLPVVYLVQSDMLRPVSGFVFEQRGYKFSDVLTGPDAEISAMPKGSTLPPLDGTLVKQEGQPLIYYVGLGQKFPIPYFVFKARGYKFTDVVLLGDDEINNLSTGDHFPPEDGTLIKAQDDPTVYLVEAGELHGITGFLFGLRGYKFSDIIEVTKAELQLIPLNSPVVLPEGSLLQVKGDGTVYILEDGIRHAMNLAAFNNRGLSFDKVIVIPQVEADRYPSGSPYIE